MLCWQGKIVECVNCGCRGCSGWFWCFFVAVISWTLGSTPPCMECHGLCVPHLPAWSVTEPPCMECHGTSLHWLSQTVGSTPLCMECHGLSVSCHRAYMTFHARSSPSITHTLRHSMRWSKETHTARHIHSLVEAVPADCQLYYELRLLLPSVILFTIEFYRCICLPTLKIPMQCILLTKNVKFSTMPSTTKLFVTARQMSKLRVLPNSKNNAKSSNALLQMIYEKQREVTDVSVVSFHSIEVDVVQRQNLWHDVIISAASALMCVEGFMSPMQGWKKQAFFKKVEPGGFYCGFVFWG